jgi:hypothetical protein
MVQLPRPRLPLVFRARGQPPGQEGEVHHGVAAPQSAASRPRAAAPQSAAPHLRNVTPQEPLVGKERATLETAATLQRVEVLSSVASRGLRPRKIAEAYPTPYMGSTPDASSAARAGKHGTGQRGKTGIAPRCSGRIGARPRYAECCSSGGQKRRAGETLQTITILRRSPSNAGCYTPPSTFPLAGGTLARPSTRSQQEQGSIGGHGGMQQTTCTWPWPTTRIQCAGSLSRSSASHQRIGGNQHRTQPDGETESGRGSAK